MKKFYSSIAFMFLLLANVYGQFDATITISDEVSTLPLENVDVFLDGQAGYTNASGQVTFTNLNDGTYQYSFVFDCYETGSESLTIAGANLAESAVMTPATTNSVFFFVGSPLTLPGATVSLFDAEGYLETLTTGNFLGDIFENVPFGDYNYTIELDCYETISGSVTVACIGGGQGVVVAENPVQIILDNSVTVVANTLTANEAGLSYQWVDCENGNAEIEGATGQSFTAVEDGSYAVVISSENCSTTSECFSIIVTGIFDATPAIDVSVYPNPFVANLNIRLTGHGGKTFVEIMSITGQLIIQENFTNSEFMTLNVSDLASGNYLLRVRNDFGQYSAPIIKQ